MKQVMADLEAGRVAPVYLFYGNEPGPMRAIAQKLREVVLEPGFEAFNHERFLGREVESVARVLEACAQLPVLAKRRLVEVDDPEAIGKGRAAAAEASKQTIDALIGYAKQPNPTTVLVLSCSGLDGRSRLVAAVKKAGVVRKFEHLRRDRDAVDFVLDRAKQAGAKLGREEAAELVGLVGTGQSELLTALERAAVYAGEGARITATDIAAVAAHTRDAVIFELTDAVGMGQRDKALTVLRHLFRETPSSEIGQASAVLVMLIRQLRLIFIARSAGSPARVEAAASVPSFVARKLAQQARGWSPAQLRRAYAGLARLDRDLKGGAISVTRAPLIALQRWVLDACDGLPGAASRV